MKANFKYCKGYKKCFLRGLVEFKQDENQHKISKFEMVYFQNLIMQKNKIFTIV